LIPPGRFRLDGLQSSRGFPKVFLAAANGNDDRTGEGSGKRAAEKAGDGE